MTNGEKEKAIEYFKWWKSFNEQTQLAIPKDTIAYKAYQTEIGFYDMAIKALEQEPFINKPCVSSEVCEHDKQKVLDKIRAEIKALTSNRGFLSCSVDHIHEEIDAVFDKYMAESEG